MAFSLYPAFVVIDEHSEFGLHKRTLPTRAWTGTTGTPGEYSAWDTSVAQADLMIEALVDLLAATMVTTYNFDAYTIYTMTSETATPQPRYQATLNVPGVLTAADAVPASQGTMSFRTAAFGKFKITFLDAIPSGDFKPQLPGGFTAAQTAIAAALSNSGNAWSARDNSQIGDPQRLTWTLNEKLRKAYRLG